MIHPLVRRLLAATLVLLLLPLPRLRAQAVASDTQGAGPAMLHIDILEGEGALNNIRERTAREPIVQVTDENHKPVAGALVVFSLVHGSSGADGVFTTPNGTTSLFRTTTGSDGRATAHGLQPNATAGQFSITVEASVGSVTTVTVIHMVNSLFGGTSTSTNPGDNPSTSTSSTPTSTPGHGPHLFHLAPHWIVIGATVVVTVTVVAVVVATRSSGATISAGTGGVTHP